MFSETQTTDSIHKSHKMRQLDDSAVSARKLAALTISLGCVLLAHQREWGKRLSFVYKMYIGRST